MNTTDSKTPLTWALAIATYQRADILLECLELGATQTRPPAEVIVVDASPDWEQTKDTVMRDLAPRFADIAWRYEKARVASSAAQRNQCIDAATADILFLIDDDSLMHRDCAERIMRVYDMDPEKQVAGASPMETPVRPKIARADDAHDAAATQAKADEVGLWDEKKKYGRVMRLARRLLSAKETFIPYDETFPDKPLPPGVEDLPGGVGRRLMMAGMTMTCRRELAVENRFCEFLARASYCEDSDMSYRLSRLGVLATVFSAQLHHVGSPGGRMKLKVGAALAILNQLVFHRLHSTDLARSKRRYRSMLRRRWVVATLKDLKAKRWSLPTARGVGFAMGKIDEVFAKDKAELETWYPAYQKELIDQEA